MCENIINSMWFMCLAYRILKVSLALVYSEDDLSLWLAELSLSKPVLSVLMAAS